MLTKKQKELAERIKVELLEEAKKTDFEVAHEKADLCLCKLLDGLGLNDVSEAYRKVCKWYA